MVPAAFIVLAVLCLYCVVRWTITHTFILNWSSGGGNLLATLPASATGEVNLSFTVAGAVTNQAEALAFVRANVVSLYMMSDQDVTLKTNSSGSPQDTIALKANTPVVWYANGGYAISALFAGNVTASYWSNAGATIANVNVRLLVTA